MNSMRSSKLVFVPALLLLSAACVTFTACKKEVKQLGIATYSVEGLESDVEGSFKALADDGYTVMEIWKYNAKEGTVNGYAPADYAALAEKYGLDIISSHASAKFDVQDPEGTLAAWGKLFDDHKAMGCRYVVFPSYIWSTDVEVLKTECELMNKVGGEANKRGLKFGYHNHSDEFVAVPGTDMLLEDFLIANTDPAKVLFQMDVYWTVVGGQDPVSYLQKYPDRIKLLHIKDDYVVGESGKIDFRAIFDQFYQNGGKDWFVEMEAAMPSDSVPVAEQLKTSLEGIRLSAEYLKNADFVK